VTSNFQGTRNQKPDRQIRRNQERDSNDPGNNIKRITLQYAHYEQIGRKSLFNKRTQKSGQIRQRLAPFQKNKQEGNSFPLSGNRRFPTHPGKPISGKPQGSIILPTPHTIIPSLNGKPIGDEYLFSQASAGQVINYASLNAITGDSSCRLDVDFLAEKEALLLL